MKIAIATTGDDLDAKVDPRFGRCRKFAIVDTDDMSMELLDNRSADAGHGAGIEAAQVLANMDCDGVVATNFGPNAAFALAQGGVRMFIFSQGTVREAAEAVKAGTAEEVDAGTVNAHSGDE